MAFEESDDAMTSAGPSLALTPCHSAHAMSTEVLENGGPSNSVSRAHTLIAGSVDAVAALLEQERTHYSPAGDYLSLSRATQRTREHVTNTTRHDMCQWAYTNVDEFGYDREVVSIMLSYLDRMSSIAAKQIEGPLKVLDFKLTAISSFYLAIKLHGEVEGAVHPQKPAIKTMVALCQGVFSVEDIEAKEREILSTLGWHVNPPTMLCFIVALLRFLPDSWGYEPIDDRIATNVYEMARYLVELIVYRSDIIFQFKSSEIAYASILYALDILQYRDPFPYEARLAFQEKVAAATSLTPSTRGVLLVIFTFKRMDVFSYKHEHVDIPMPAGGLSRSSSIGSDGGTTSPVCVCEPVNNIRNQKRTRLTYE